MGIIRNAKQFVKRAFDQIARRPISAEENLVADQFFEAVKKEIIDAILEHEISQELIQHTTPSVVLGTRGSLFGFLGMPAGSDPMEEIIKIVNKTMKYTLTRRLVRMGYKMVITIPSRPDFRVPELILPWEGGYSVVDAIENGISGLSSYIKAVGHPRSVSKEGLQARHDVRNAEFGGRAWITEILRRAKELEKDFR